MLDHEINNHNNYLKFNKHTLLEFSKLMERVTGTK